MKKAPETLVVKVDPVNPDADVIAYGAKIIRDGGIVAFPTETVYGLAVNLSNKRAVERLYLVKKRSRGKPFTVHIAGTGLIREMDCRITAKAARLIKRFWPGALTIILSAKDGKKIGFRMPANRVARDLIASSGVPVIAPSANLSGRRPPTNVKDVLRDLDGKIDMIIDSGHTEIRIESTVIDLTTQPPAILREGAISSKRLKKALKPK